MYYDVIVIGGGAAGLSTGAILSKNGYSVLLLEKNSNLGGRATVLKRDEYIVDNGIHFVRFADYSKCAKVFTCLNQKIKFHLPGKSLVYQGGKFFDFPEGILSFLKTDLVSRRTKLKLLSYALSSPFKNIRRFFVDTSIANLLLPLKPDKDFIDLVKLFLLASIVCPEIHKASAREIRKFFKTVSYAKGTAIGYPKGGWKTIFDILKTQIRTDGNVLTNTLVKKILIEGDEVKKVLTEKEEFTAKAVVCTIPFQYLSQIMDIKILPYELQNYSKSVEQTCGIVLDFGLKKKVSAINGVIMTKEPLAMGCFTSNIEPLLAPESKQLASWYCFATPEEIQDETLLKERLSKLKNLLAEMFPHIWDFVEWERVIFLKMVDGAVPKVGQTFKERPRFSGNIKNLFFAGDTTAGEGWGSEIAFDSAIKCSDLVKKYLKR